MRSIFTIFVLTFGIVMGVSGQTKTDVKSETTSIQPNIVQVAIQLNSAGSPYEGQFDTLIAAVLAADPIVARTLTGRGQYTVFAPTDSAFAALGIDASNVGTLDAGFLTDVLTYHVALGRRYAADVLESKRIRTISKMFFFVSPSGVITDAVGRNANIIATDVEASNGVIHAIDQVILPYTP